LASCFSRSSGHDDIFLADNGGSTVGVFVYDIIYIDGNNSTLFCGQTTAADGVGVRDHWGSSGGDGFTYRWLGYMSEKERRDILSGTGEDLKYAKSLGFVDAHIDPKTGRVMIPRVQMLQVQEEVVRKEVKTLKREPIKREVGPGNNRQRYPGKGASDEEWRRYAAETYALPGAKLTLPVIPRGRGRGWTILRLIKGEGIEYEWTCGCRRDKRGSEYRCGKKDCLRE